MSMPLSFRLAIVISRRTLGLLAAFFLSCACSADNVQVAVASNFAAPMTALIDEFNKASGHTVRTSFGSSGKLYAQIINGAPFDIFFSADQVKPKKLVDSGYAQAENLRTYAIGALVLLSNSAVDDPLEQLKSGHFQRLSLANPKFAPYGIAALEVLKNLGLELETRNKRIFGENISQTFQYVSSGNVDLGFVAWSQVKALPLQQGQSLWRVPEHLSDSITQDTVLLNRAKTNQAARAFFNFLQGSQAENIIRQHGYRVVKELPTDKGS